MELTITLGDITRRYQVEDEDIINTDWSEKIIDMLDSQENV